jgi:hypothetical protein
MRVFKVDAWNHVLVEGFCMINVDYYNKRGKYMYIYPDLRDMKMKKRIANPEYDPSIKPDKKPTWCEGHVCTGCLNGGNMCQHFNYGTPEKAVRKGFRKLIRKISVKCRKRGES